MFLAVLAVPASAAAPAATGLPAISGNARAGQILTSTTGVFAGTAPLTYGRTWQRCDNTGGACAPIVGASAVTYTLAAADVGKTIRLAVIATNLEGSASATSAVTPIVAPLAPPLNGAGGEPVVSGTARDGQVLSATDGAWSGTAPITFTRLWQRCDIAGAACAALASAATRTLTSTDVGSTIRVEVTAHNADGQGVATSVQTAVVDGAAPVNTVLPAVSGPARSGQTLTSTTTGTWTGTVPMTFARQWTSCDAGGGACSPIAGAVATTYVLSDADIGQTIRVAVTATNVKSAATASSAATATVGPRVPPQKATDPSIAGPAIDGQVLTAIDGTWIGTATITTSRRWQRCAPLGVNCVDLAATGTTLTLTSADVGSTIRTQVTATNPDGTTQVPSTLSPAIAPAVPAATAAPAVSGTAREGQLLTATQGTWKGTPAISYAYAWERCVAGACSAIAGETATTYRVAAADVGRTVRAAVTATNAGGTTTTPSAATATVTGGIPVNVDLPAISGALPRDGELYAGTLGAWTGTAPLVYDRQWLRCNAIGGACTPVSGEIAGSYRFAALDIGKTLRLEVSVTNAFGAAKAQSAPSPVILPAPPTADAAPAIAGVLLDGQTLTAVSAWSGTAPISLSYQWQRCDATAATCVNVAGATASTYVLRSAEVGSRMRVQIGALSAGGGGFAASDLAVAGDPAGLVAPDSPHATGAPVLTGSAIEGATLTSSDGTFAGTLPLTSSIRWQRCDGAGGGCADIAGATGSGRVLTAADRGATVRTVVTALNGLGSDSIASAPSPVVAMAPPRNLVAPSVSPDTGLRDGATLTSTDGGWAGSQPQTLAYRWQRCTSTACVDVAGARDSTYMLTTTDVSFALRLVVTASNGAGSTSQPSALTGVVGTNPPVNVVAPTVSGTTRDGEALTAIDGTWIGPIVFQTTYEWWRCDALGANCSIVPGATSASRVLVAADVGLSLRARITRTSAGGTTAAFSAPTSPVVAAPPLSISSPQITGPAAVGRTLTADHGSWAGTPALVFAYQWRRCATDGSACADIAGAVAPTYPVTADDGQTSLRVAVTTTNAVGTASVTSASTAVVQTDPPMMLTPPRIVVPAGPVAVGVTLTVLPGSWVGATPISFQYQWARCDAAAVGCAAIAGATESTYLLAKADAARRIVVTVTATNVVDTATVVADATTVVLPEPPSNVTPPAVTAPSGIRDGARLVASTGTWNGAIPLTYAISWLRCAADGTGCAAVPDASGTTYTLTAADVGHRVRARVAAANATAEITTDSAATTAVAPLPPPATPPATSVPSPATVTSTVKAPAAVAPPATATVKPVTAGAPASATGVTTKKSTTVKKATTTKTTTTTRKATTPTNKRATAKKRAATKKSATKKKPAVKKKAAVKKKSETKRKSATKKRATAKKSAGAKTTSGTSSKSASTRPIAAVQRLRITTAGQLIVVLSCPRYRTRACGATGTVVAGTALGEVISDTPLSFTIPPGVVPKGRTRTRTFKLDDAQLAEIGKLTDVNFRVRLSTPGRPQRVNEVFVHASVPVALRAPVEDAPAPADAGAAPADAAPAPA